MTVGNWNVPICYLPLAPPPALNWNHLKEASTAYFDFYQELFQPPCRDDDFLTVENKSWFFLRGKCNKNPASRQFLGLIQAGRNSHKLPSPGKHCSYRERMGLLVSNKENRYIITSLTFSALVVCARWWCWRRTWWSRVELWLRWIIELASAEQSNS